MSVSRNLLALIIALFMVGSLPLKRVAIAQTEGEGQEESGEKEGKKEKKRAKKGAKWGAVAGGGLGLLMGAATGDAKMAAAGAAVGAAAGAGAGAMYEYDQGKQDDRTQQMADAIAARPPAGGAAPAASQQTVGDAGRQQMEMLRGSWKIDIWYLDAEGNRKTATGAAQGLAAGDNGTRILYRDIKAEGFEAVYDGYALLTYDPGQGFFLENSFSTTDEIVKSVGEYLPDKNAYNFYVMQGDGGEMIQGGIMRSSARFEIRIAGPAMFVAETFTLIDGKEVQVQQYRFTKS